MEDFNNYYSSLPEYTKKYFNILYKEIPIECKEYIEEIIRLNDISYFCGMKYASSYLYNFKYDFSRLDHSISTMLEILKLTNNFEMAICALLHDCKTPIFSHVIDYLNNDYIMQESSEQKNVAYVLNNNNLNKLCNRDNIDIELISNPKNFSLIDNERPKLCIDRLDGIFLNALSWTNEITFNDIEKIYNDITIAINEYNEEEISFKTKENAKIIHNLEININKYTHSDKDMFAMFLLSDIVKYCIDNNYINYDEIYELTEKEMIKIIEKNYQEDLKLYLMWMVFTTTNNIVMTSKVRIKKRYVNPLINNKRLNNI